MLRREDAMNLDEAIPVFFRLFFAFLAAFPAIALWSKVRDAAWMCMVLAALFAFIDAVYALLVMIGLATYSLPFLSAFPLLKTLLGIFPSLFLAMGFLSFLNHRRRY